MKAAGLALLIALAAGLAGCDRKVAPPPPASAEKASAFVARVNRGLADRYLEAQLSAFTHETFITPDTELLRAKATERYLAALGQAVEESRGFAQEAPAPADARAPALL